MGKNHKLDMRNFKLTSAEGSNRCSSASNYVAKSMHNNLYCTFFSL